jgi:hypothetical protein
MGLKFSFLAEGKTWDGDDEAKRKQPGVRVIQFVSRKLGPGKM